MQRSAARWRSAVFVWLIGAAALTASLTGCGTGGAEHPGATTVVASTDVWGSVASAVAGGHVAVKSILTSANADPHSYAASPSDAAAITDAALVVYNGGGYDPWVDRVLAAHPAINSIDAYSLLGTTTDKHPRDEHVFYDLAVAKAVAVTIADRLASIDPGHAAEYRTNAAVFGRAAGRLWRRWRPSSRFRAPPSRTPSTDRTSFPPSYGNGCCPRRSGWATCPIPWRDRCAPAKPARSVW